MPLTKDKAIRFMVKFYEDKGFTLDRAVRITALLAKANVDELIQKALNTGANTKEVEK